MSHEGRRLAWSSDSISMIQRTKYVKGKVVSPLCDRLWISLISLSRGVMDLREVHRSLIFCPDFHISCAVGIRSRDIFRYDFIYAAMWTVTCKSVTKITYTHCVLWEASRKEMLSAGLALCTWRPCHQRGHWGLVSLRPWGTKGVLQIPPLQLALISWTRISPEHFWGSETECSAEPPWCLVTVFRSSKKGWALEISLFLFPLAVCVCWVCMPVCAYDNFPSNICLLPNSDCRDFH